MPQTEKLKCSLSRLKQRAFLLSSIRQFFALRAVLEVETPVLSSAGNTDTSIESFTSEAINPAFAGSYLRTSAEFPMKRLLCQGVGDIYEIGKVFRKGENGSAHNCEFTLLEWYRVNFSYLDLIAEVQELFLYLLAAFKKEVVTSEIISYAECFAQFLHIELTKINQKQLNIICQQQHYSGSDLSRDEALDYLFATYIQPRFAKNKLTFVTHYPASQAALAKINPKDHTTALRFEVFYQGHELGNGYEELTDANELLSRFEKDNDLRKKQKRECVEIDKNLIKAMQKGMPDCSGIAMGIDRLLMVLQDEKNIKQVISFDAKHA